MKVRFSPRAREDLLEIAEFIERDSFAGAVRVLDDIEAAVLRLCDNPGLGHVREDLVADPRLRFWPVHSHLIIYRSSKSLVEVVRVLSGYRDIARLLE